MDFNGRWFYPLSPVSPGVEAFLGFARRRLTTFHLSGSGRFNLHLKACEFRFNNRKEVLYQLLLKRFRERPLS